MVKSGVWNVLFPTSPSVNAITIAAKRLAVVKSRKVCWGRRPLLSKRVKIAGQLPKQHNESIIHPIAAVLLSITYILCFFNTKTHSFLLVFMGFASYPVIPTAFESCPVYLNRIFSITACMLWWLLGESYMCTYQSLCQQRTLRHIGVFSLIRPSKSSDKLGLWVWVWQVVNYSSYLTKNREYVQPERERESFAVFKPFGRFG